MPTETTETTEVPTMTKRQCKSEYLKANIGLTDALNCLMFDHSMDQGEALKYLGL